MRKNLYWMLLAVLFILPTAEAAPFRPEVLRDVLAQVKGASEKGDRPVVIFDLDDTLFDTRTRTVNLFKEFVGQRAIQSAFPRESRILSRMRVSDMVYYPEEALENLGIHNGEFLEKVLTFWKSKFFSNDFCAADGTISGAVPYVREVVRAGALVVYLTGRNEDDMGACTLVALGGDGFPIGDRAQLMMNTRTDVGDLAFKKIKFQEIASMGTVVAGFDNEPANVNAMKEAFPAATVVYVSTEHSNKPDVPNAALPWIKDFHNWGGALNSHSHGASFHRSFR